jgi:DNA-binding MarR family transcriptional regulator
MTVAILDLDGVCNCLAARKAARYLTAAYDKALAPVGLRITQFTNLNRLARLGPMTIKRLAAAIAMDRITLATNVKPLERDGLLLTAAAEDRRATTIEITKAGRAKLQGALPLWTRVTQVRGQLRHQGGVGTSVGRWAVCWKPDLIPGPDERGFLPT